MKKKTIDIFGIFIGVIIGGVVGYFIGTYLHQSKPTTVLTQVDQEGTVYLFEIKKSDQLEDVITIQSQLKEKNLNGEIVHLGTIYYLYGSIGGTLEDVKLDKAHYESLGFNGTIVSSYIMDLPTMYPKGTMEYSFYEDVISCFVKSLKNESFFIKDEYYQNPINIDLFSNLTLLEAIRNDTIKKQIQLDTYKQLMEWFRQ